MSQNLQYPVVQIFVIFEFYIFAFDFALKKSTFFFHTHMVNRTKSATIKKSQMRPFFFFV